VASVTHAVKRRLPASLGDRLQRWRSSVAHLIVGAEIHRTRVEATRQAAAAHQASLAELHRAVEDLLERQDQILASYDQRVAALTNRVLDLEERLASATTGRSVDANAVLAEHDEHA
jgi:hypothetical protein